MHHSPSKVSALENTVKTARTVKMTATPTVFIAQRSGLSLLKKKKHNMMMMMMVMMVMMMMMINDDDDEPPTHLQRCHVSVKTPTPSTQVTCISKDPQPIYTGDMYQ